MGARVRGKALVAVPMATPKPSVQRRAHANREGSDDIRLPAIPDMQDFSQGQAEPLGGLPEEPGSGFEYSRSLEVITNSNCIPRYLGNDARPLPSVGCWILPRPERLVGSTGSPNGRPLKSPWAGRYRDRRMRTGR